MMKNKRTKCIVSILLALALVFSVTAVYAGTVQPQTVGAATISFEAVSSSQGYFEVMGSSTGTAAYITSKVILQSAPIGSTNFTNVSGVAAKTKTVYNTSGILHTGYFPITTTKDYRIRVELTDEVNGAKVTSSFVKGLDW